MGYGARGRRADAKATGLVEDIDFNKVGLLCDAERGVAGLHENIYSIGDFKRKCGGFVSTYMGAYVADSFFATLNNETRVELKVINYVASDAVQASKSPQNGGPNDSFTLKAGLLGEDDKSAFGNKIGYQIENTEEMQYTLDSDIGINGTQAVLTSVDGLEVGHFVHIEDGTEDDVKKILTVDPVTKTITFSALTNAAPETVANTTVKRQDITLLVGVKDINGIWEEKEKYTRVPFQEDVATLISTLEEKSYYLIAVAVAIVETDADALPADVATWTQLTSGSDGTGSSASDFNTLVTGFNDAGVSILLAPELSTVAHNKNMIAYVNDGQKAMYYVNVPEGSTQDSLMDFGGSMRETISFAMIPMDKWFKMDDPLVPGTLKNIPNVGIKAGHYFNSYNMNGVGKVAAGNRENVQTVLLPIDNGLIHNDLEGIGDLMIRNFSVNICQWRQGIGTTINSARTLSKDKGYIFENQIMGWILIKRSILTYLQSIEQDPSGIDAQEAHFLAIHSYLKEKYDGGVFYKGQREDGTRTEMSDVVTIVNDFSINSLADIANGKEEAFVEVVFVPPIEEPILSLASAPVTSI